MTKTLTCWSLALCLLFSLARAASADGPKIAPTYTWRRRARSRSLASLERSSTRSLNRRRSRPDLQHQDQAARQRSAEHVGQSRGPPCQRPRHQGQGRQAAGRGSGQEPTRRRRRLSEQLGQQRARASDPHLIETRGVRGWLGVDEPAYPAALAHDVDERRRWVDEPGRAHGEEAQLAARCATRRDERFDA